MLIIVFHAMAPVVSAKCDVVVHTALKAFNLDASNLCHQGCCGSSLKVHNILTC